MEADGYNNPGKEENRPKVCNDGSGESSSSLGFVFKEGKQEKCKKVKKIKKVLEILGPMCLLDTHGKIERAFVYRS